MMFTDSVRNDLGIYHDENYKLVSCCGGHIVFSYAQKGNAMTAHIASDTIGLRNVKPAINSFCQWLFDHYRWCEMIFGVINNDLSSMKRIVKKCHFDYLTGNDKHSVYARTKQ